MGTEERAEMRRIMEKRMEAFTMELDWQFSTQLQVLIQQSNYREYKLLLFMTAQNAYYKLNILFIVCIDSF
jgi:hypothetical protein